MGITDGQIKALVPFHWPRMIGVSDMAMFTSHDSLRTWCSHTLEHAFAERQLLPLTTFLVCKRSPLTGQAVSEHVPADVLNEAREWMRSQGMQATETCMIYVVQMKLSAQVSERNKAIYDASIRECCRIGDAQAVITASEAFVRCEEADTMDEALQAAEALPDSIAGLPGTMEVVIANIETRAGIAAATAQIEPGPPRKLLAWDHSYGAMVGRFTHYLSQVDA